MSEYGPDIYVEDVLVHRNYFSSLFHDNPWYFFILWAKDPSGLHFGLWKLPFDY